MPATANNRGTIEFDTPTGGQISVLGIRTTPLGASTTITTVPPLANVGTGGGSFAFVAEGGDGWQTTFVLVNTGANSASATLSFLATQRKSASAARVLPAQRHLHADVPPSLAR